MPGTDAADLDGAGGTDTVVSSLDANYVLTDAQLTRTVGATSLVFTLANFEGATLTGGATNNTFDVSSWTKAATLDGGLGTADRLIAAGDTSYTLAAASLARTGLPALTLAGIEGATLTGGVGDNTFTVSGWLGDAILDGGGGTDTVVSSNASGFTLSDSQLRRTVGTGTFNLTSIEAARLTGGAALDVFTVTDWTGTAVLDGGLSTDTIVASNNGDFGLSNTLLTRTGRGDLTLAGFEAATLTAGDGDNTLTLTNWLGTATLTAGLGTDRLNVTSDAADLTLSETSLLRTAQGTLTLAGFESAGLTGGAGANRFVMSAWNHAADLDGAGGTDTVVSALDANYVLTDAQLTRTVGATSLVFTLANFEGATLTGGATNNTFDVSSWTKAATLDGGLGTADRLIAAGDTSYTLAAASLARTGLPALTLAGIEGATLTGGVGDNTFTVSGWLGDAILDGGGGTDTVVSSNASGFTLSDSQLRRTVGTGTFNLTSIEAARLTGGAALDVFTVTDWTGTAVLDGGLSTDTIVASNNGDFGLSNTLLTRTGRGDLTLAGFEAATLTAGDGDNTLTLTNWLGTATLTAGLGTDRLNVTSDAADLTLSETSLLRTAQGTLTLAGFESAGLTGGAGANRFVMSAWNHAADLDGAGGTDTVVSALDANYVLTDAQLTRTVGATSLVFTLANFEGATLTGGATNNTFDVSSWTKAATLDGGLGTADRLIAAGDTSYTLAAASLARTGLPALTLAGIEGATLTGGVGDNTFTVSGWLGDAILDGGGGTDTVVSSNASGFTLSDSQLRRTVGTGTFNLTSIEAARLTGGAALDVFTVTDWTGTAVLDGGLSTDTIVASNNGDFGLSNTLLTRTGRGDLTLAGFEAATLTAGDGDNTLTLTNWLGTATLTAGLGTDRLNVTSDAADLTLSETSLLRMAQGDVDLGRVRIGRIDGRRGCQPLRHECLEPRGRSRRRRGNRHGRLGVGRQLRLDRCAVDADRGCHEPRLHLGQLRRGHAHRRRYEQHVRREQLDQGGDPRRGPRHGRSADRGGRHKLHVGRGEPGADGLAGLDAGRDRRSDAHWRRGRQHVHRQRLAGGRDPRWRRRHRHRRLQQCQRVYVE